MKIINDITKFIFIEDSLAKVDAIFIPGTSISDLAEKAAKIWCDGYSKYIIPTGMYSSKLGYFPSERTNSTPYEGVYKTECDYFIEVLTRCGVPREAIIEERESQNTYDNAIKAKKVIEELNIIINKAIICCQSFHARRVYMTYSLVFPETEIYIFPVDTRGINRDTWFTFEYGIERVMGELVRIGKYFSVDISRIGIKT